MNRHHYLIIVTKSRENSFLLFSLYGRKMKKQNVRPFLCRHKTKYCCTVRFASNRIFFMSISESFLSLINFRMCRWVLVDNGTIDPPPPPVIETFLLWGLTTTKSPIETVRTKNFGCNVMCCFRDVLGFKSVNDDRNCYIAFTNL